MSSFEFCFGCCSYSPLDIPYGQQGVREDLIGDALREDKFIIEIRNIHLQV